MTITEASAAEKIDSLRKGQEGFIEPSFHTISAYNANAAMMHYRAVANKCATLQPEGFLLIDSGGQYYQGTTDITRTIALGKLSDTMKLHFTTVLKSMISLSKATFLYGCSGRNLDILARGPIWNLGIDYRSGTGHGIGFLLNVHEAPNGFRWRKVGDRNDGGTLEEGMVTSNEPGIYIEGQYGIRIENEIVVKKDVENEYGQFMKFDTVTFAPIDLDAIDPSVLTTEEKAWLNAYHQMVYENLAPHLEVDEKAWLKEYTREI
ncbi:MAG: M24 family metallopeptidase [Erysipelotrichaceae bacterium]|nr:M24 family metallopeptidase [Erysipelotrichaceae bacterium]